MFVSEGLNFIDDIHELTAHFNNREEELLLFPLEKEGETVLEFLNAMDWHNRFGCIVAESTAFNNSYQAFCYDLPVIPLEMLVHFHESATLIIGAPQSRVVELEKNLSQTGFKNIIILGSNLIALMESDLKRLNQPTEKLLRTITRVDEKLNRMLFRVEVQNEICATNTAAFAEYEKRFRGKDIVIFGTGPSSKYYEQLLLPDAIHIGLNFACLREDISFDYLFLIDPNVLISPPV